MTDQYCEEQLTLYFALMMYFADVLHLMVLLMASRYSVTSTHAVLRSEDLIVLHIASRYKVNSTVR